MSRIFYLYLFRFLVEESKRHALILWLEKSDLERIGFAEFENLSEVFFSSKR